MNMYVTKLSQVHVYVPLRTMYGRSHLKGAEKEEMRKNSSGYFIFEDKKGRGLL